MRRLLVLNVAACVLLFVQYLLGMAVNVSVVIPGRHPGANASDYFSGAVSGLGWVIGSGPGWAAAHAAFGLALVVAAIAAVVLARGHGRTAVVLPVVGALAVIGAGFNGMSFVNYGHAFSSMIMATLWALALACYLAGAIRAAVHAGAGGQSLLAHRIYAEAGSSAPDGEQVARHVVTGGTTQLTEAFASYAELGVGDLSVVLGHDDESAMRTLEVLLSDVLPAIPQQR